MNDLRHYAGELEQMQSLPLEIKIRMTKMRIQQWVYAFSGEAYISFSGGKDSTVLLNIAREVFPNLPAVFCDTGLEYPEIREFVKRFENVVWLKPQMNFRQVIQKYGYPLISKSVANTLRGGHEPGSYRWKKLHGEVFLKNGKPSKFNCVKWQFLLDAPFKVSEQCCDVMKKRPFHKYQKETGQMPIVATMADESMMRKNSWMKYGCNAFDRASGPQSRPMSFWTERDVLEYLIKYDVPYASVYRYIYQNDMLIADVEAGEHENYFMVEEEGQEPKGFNWTRIPLIPFKYNKQEIPLIRRVKTLQDGINVMLSDFENNMQEDARNTILVLKNYDGENLGEFRHNLSTYGAVKVREDGGVETLQVEINAENYKGILELLKKSLIENARGYDAKDDRLSGNPNQMNIQSMYSDIDLDANGMETEFQAAFEELLWFINQDFSNRGLGDYEGAELQIVFNRDILINETESIENCAKSVGILSTETIVEQHPWVTDVEVELARLRKEKDEAMEQAQEYAGAFQTGNQNKGDDGEGE